MISSSFAQSTNPRWFLGLGSLLLILLFGSLALNDYLARDTVLELQHENQGRLQALAVQSAQMGLRQQGELFAAMLATRPEMLRLVRQADQMLREGAAWDSEPIQALRRRLYDHLKPAWQVLEQHRALQLHIYWGEAGIALLRMQDPDDYGDAVADHRPLLYAALHRGQMMSGLDVGRHSTGNRTIVPLRASDAPDSPVIGAVEVGFGILPEVSMLGRQLDAGLAVLINQSQLDKRFWKHATSFPLEGLEGWHLQAHSAPHVLHWAAQRILMKPGSSRLQQLMAHDGRHFLLNQIPLLDQGVSSTDSAPLAVAMVWSDVTSALDEHLQTERRLLMQWGVAWLIAEALLLVLVWLLHRRAAVQHQHHLHHLREERNRNRLLDRAQKITSLLPGMVFQLRRYPDGRQAFLYASDGASEIFGLAPECLLHDASIAFATVVPEDLPGLLAALGRSSGRLGKGTTRFRISNPQKGLIWVDVKATAERLRDGSILWHGFIADITQLMGTTLALRDSESRFRSMVSNLPGVVYRRGNDENRTLNYLSTGIERLTGYPASDFVAPGTRSYFSLVHPDDLARAQQADSDFEHTYRLINARGQIIWVQENRRALRDADGRVLWYDGFIWDVTQRILAEQALRASQEHLASLYRLAPVGIMLSRLDDGHLLEWNPELQRVSGYSAEQLTDCNVLRLLPDPRNGHGTVKQLLQKGSYGPRETTLRRLDGKQVPVLLNGTLITGSDGSLLVWSIVQDITARAAAESEAREREAREREAYLRLLIANVVDAIIIIDAQGTIETFNHAAERIFDYDEKDVIGQNVSLLMPEPYRSGHTRYLSAAEKREGQRILEQNRELMGLRRNGETFNIELRVSEIRHGGECKFIGLVRDITERKRIDRMKRDFVSVVSHELRTPLTSITGALGLMTGGALGVIPDAIRQMLDIAQQNSQRLGLLIDDLLDMDKLIAGKMPLDMQVQSLTPLLLEAKRSNQGYFDQHGVRCEVGELADVQVSVDSNRLQQVLANFLSNAAKFSPTGEVVVLSSRREGDHVQVSVTDQGPGVPPSFREHIFQKFSQADSSDTRQKGGTGLGLAISKGLIEHMHGRIGFDTERTLGARFWFELPVQESSAIDTLLH